MKDQGKTFNEFLRHAESEWFKYRADLAAGKVIYAIGLGIQNSQVMKPDSQPVRDVLTAKTFEAEIAAIILEEIEACMDVGEEPIDERVAR